MTSKQAAEASISWFRLNKPGHEIDRAEFFAKMKELGGVGVKTLRDEWIRPYFVRFAHPVRRMERATRTVSVCDTHPSAARYIF